LKITVVKLAGLDFAKPGYGGGDLVGGGADSGHGDYFR
jgi:hypothetical protein